MKQAGAEEKEGGKLMPPEIKTAPNPDTFQSLEYYMGYRKACMDLHTYLSKCEPNWKADRRNNLKNVIGLLECILGDPNIFAMHLERAPIYVRKEGKKNIYFYQKEGATNDSGTNRKNGH